MGSFKEFSSAELDDLVSSVNAQRLANFPVSLSSAEIRRIYESIGS
ncbi:phosphonoacetaldehyde reductase [Gordonibacter sp. Marseille-P4307]|nr:phosphonoacetaldehyde reductase [Gordonibacter sp. Marseille-P4307]